MKKDIIFVISFISLPNESGNDRFLDIIRRLDAEKYTIEIIYSSFCHSTKKQREENAFDSPYTFTMLYESGYPTNICLKRLRSHKVFSKNIRKYLEQRKKPDLIYCSIPSLDVGYECAKYAKKNDVPYFIDIQDLWPEAFKLKFSMPLISDFVFFPMKKKANYIYKQADKVIAVSETYLQRGLDVNKKDKQGLSVFLGTDFNKLEESLSNTAPDFLKKNDEIWIGYIGTLGSSYDLETAIKAMQIIQRKYPKAILIVLGDGPLEKEFKSIAEDLNVNTRFLGRLEYYQAMSILKLCDIALNPIKKGSAGSIINKVGDYAALGLPVVNSLQCPEYMELLEKYNAGINVECENPNAMSKAILLLIQNNTFLSDLQKGSKKLGVVKFNRNNTYNVISMLIDKNIESKY